MEQNSQYNIQKYILESQIRDEYGKLVYTYTCHNKMIKRYSNYINLIKWGQILLSAVTTGSFMTTFFGENWKIGIIGAISSVIIFILNTCPKDLAYQDKLIKHKISADSLWILKEKYISLIADIPAIEIKEIMDRRDNLIIETSEVYKNSPNTDNKSYKEAQQALKRNEEQFFEEWEIDLMLPEDLRRCNRKNRTL